MIILPPEPEPDARPGPYVGSRVVLANMHGKDTAIAPVLRARLGLVVTTAPDLDTDVLGTFTGEIPRAGTIREVAKARLGMAATGLPIGIASEGSYERMGWMPPPAGIVRCLRAPARRVRRKEPMSDIHVLAIDLAKRSFQVCATARGGGGSIQPHGIARQADADVAVAGPLYRCHGGLCDKPPLGPRGARPRP